MGSAEPKLGNRGEYKFQNVCHGGTQYKLYYYPTSFNFQCYTRCGESMDIYLLTMKAKALHGYDLSFPEAVKYVANLTGKHLMSSSGKGKKADDLSWASKYMKKEKINTGLTIYNDVVLDVFEDYYHPEWIKEGISIETMKRFEIGYYLRRDYISIPQRDPENNLVGIRGRAMRAEDIDAGMKYIPLTIEMQQYNLPSLMYLYGLHIAKYAIKKIKKVIIFEAEKSVLKSYTFYGDDSIALSISGGKLSKFHIQMLLRLGVEEVILAFDKEEIILNGSETEDEIEKIKAKNLRYKQKIRGTAEEIAVFCKASVIWDFEGLLCDKDAPIDRGQEIFERLMLSRFTIGSKEGDLVGV